MPTPPDTDHAARLAQHVATVTATPTPLVMPTIHPNGSGARRLAEDNAMSADDVDTLVRKLCRRAPNSRDYLTYEAYEAARVQHENRLATLDKIRDEYVALYEHCRDAERTG